MLDRLVHTLVIATGLASEAVALVHGGHAARCAAINALHAQEHPGWQHAELTHWLAMRPEHLSFTS